MCFLDVSAPAQREQELFPQLICRLGCIWAGTGTAGCLRHSLWHAKHSMPCDEPSPCGAKVVRVLWVALMPSGLLLKKWLCEESVTDCHAVIFP